MVFPVEKVGDDGLGTSTISKTIPYPYCPEKAFELVTIFDVRVLFEDPNKPMPVMLLL